MTRTVCRGLALSLLVSSIGLVACSGGSTPPPNEPDPSLEPAPSEGSDPNAVQPASSSKVSEGMNAIQKQDFEAAKAVLSEARKEAPKDPQAAYYLGVALHSLGDTEGAEKEYAAALELDPKLTEASINLSQLELESKKLTEALATVEAGLKHAPKQPDLLLNRALILEASGKQAEALSAYGEAAAARPDDAELNLAYADLLRQAGRNEEALKVLKRVQTDDPTLLAATARQFGLNKAFSECIASLDKAIKVKSTPDLLVRRGVCRHEMKDDPGAVADYEAALKADPNFAPAHYYLGMHLRGTDKKKAIAELEKAAAIAKDEGVGPAAKRELEALKKKK
jgi:Flp pilus assembly protein TadD